MALLLAGVIVVITLELEETKHALHLQGGPAFAVFADFGSVTGIDAIGGLLEKPSQELGRRLE